jgi:hypothetical protein
MKLRNMVVVAAQQVTHGPSPSNSAVGVGSEDFDDRIILEEGDWDTDVTFDLVEQMRDVLVLAEKQRLNLFASSDVRGTDITPVKSKRKAGRFSSIASPIAARPSLRDDPATSPQRGTAVSGAALLERLLLVLRGLIDIDCLHRIHLFSPFRPPNALQAACLSIATFLYHKCEIQTKLQVVEMVVDGLYTMGEGMAERICQWIEGRLGELLGRLARERGGPGREHMDFQGGCTRPLKLTSDPFAVSSPSKSIPTFAISEAEEIHKKIPGWMQYSPTNPGSPIPPDLGEFSGLLSTHTPSAEASSTTRQIAAIVSRLIVAITSTINLVTSKLSTIHRVHRLLSLTLTAKPDLAIDLLEILAQSRGAARRSSMEILATFFPRAFGHTVIARRPALNTYAALRVKWETGQDRVLAEDDIDGHEWLPWRASSKDGHAASRSSCEVCDADIHGFAVRCILCGDLRHLHCYQPKDEVFLYDVVTLSSAESHRQTAHVKFGLCLPHLHEQILDSASRPGELTSTRRRVGQHDLRAVNLFNLTLCDECHEPIWGISAQAYACYNGCQRFFHPHCTDRLGLHGHADCRYGKDIVVDEISPQRKNPFVISSDALRASFAKATDVYLPQEKVASRSYDEVAVCYGVLWTQHQLLKNGIASGSIRLTGENRAESDILGWRQTLKAYEEYLKGHSHEASMAAADFSKVSGLEQVPGLGYLFSDRYLTYCSALLRAPSAAQPAGSDGLLTASGLPMPPIPGPQGAFEMLPLSTLRRSLASDLNIHDNRAAAALFERLRAIGLCASAVPITPTDIVDGDAWVGFTLPLLMDSSPTVELLIVAIESLLDDLDLTMNEHGMLLLTTRAFPSLLCSPYALERLGNALVSWVMAEVSRRLLPPLITGRRPARDRPTLC